MIEEEREGYKNGLRDDLSRLDAVRSEWSRKITVFKRVIDICPECSGKRELLKNFQEMKQQRDRELKQIQESINWLRGVLNGD